MKIDNVNFEWLDMEARLESAAQAESEMINLALTDAHRVLLGSAVALEVEARNQVLRRLHLGRDSAWRAIRRLPDWFFAPPMDLDDSRLFEFMNLHWGNRRVDCNHRMRYWAWHGWFRGIQECYPFVARIVDVQGDSRQLPDMWHTKVPRVSPKVRDSFRLTEDFVMELGGRVLYIPGIGAVPTVKDFAMDWSGTVALLRFRPNATYPLRMKLAFWNEEGQCDFRQAAYNDPSFSNVTDLGDYFNIRTALPAMVQTGFGELDAILAELFHNANEQYWRKVIEFLTDSLGVDEAMAIIRGARNGRLMENN